MRYIDDFVVCFQYRSDAERVEQALLRKRLAKFALALEPTKTQAGGVWSLCRAGCAQSYGEDINE